VFSRKTEQLVEEYDLIDFNLEHLQEVFGVEDPKDPMYAEFPITHDNLHEVSAYVEESICWDFENKSYFFSACAI
jgi:hypothetical protein